jgi:glycosyltransferase involved in cell wall biosynthesis
VPCVVSDGVGVGAELAREGFAIRTATQPPALAAAIEQALAMAGPGHTQRARAFVSANFSSAKIGGDMAAMYRESINSSLRPGRPSANAHKEKP